MDDDSAKPGCGLYLLALVVFLGGIGGAVAMSYPQFTSFTTSSQVSAPGTSQLDCSEQGSYMIFLAKIDGKEVEPKRVQAIFNDLECTVVEKKSGDQIPVTKSDVAVAGAPPGDGAGPLFLQFEVKDPGEYEITANYPQGKEGPAVDLIVWRGSIISFVMAIMKSIALIGATSLVALVMVIVAFVRRSRAKTQTSSNDGWR